MKTLISILRSFLHKVRILRWLIFPKKNKLDLFGSSMISLSGRWKTEFDPFLTYISMFLIMNQRGFKGSLLEFGGGYSTVLAVQVLKRLTKFRSIDINPQKYFRILNSKKNLKRFSNFVEIVPEITVSFEEVKNSYITLKKEFSKYQFELVNESLSLYAGDYATELSDVIFRNNENSLLEFIENKDSFKDEVNFYIDNNMLSNEGFCTKLTKDSNQVDAIFYDCGEISSNAEWFATSKLIPLGGYVLLHDIYYPKSIKNVFIATLISLSDEWEIIFIDKESSQGGLLAQRVSW